MPRFDAVIGYTFDADTWCPDCAQSAHRYQCPHEPRGCSECGLPLQAPAHEVTSSRFDHGYVDGDLLPVVAGTRSCVLDPMLDEHGISTTAVDYSGDTLGVIFPGTDADPLYGLTCGQCGSTIIEPTASEPHEVGEVCDCAACDPSAQDAPDSNGGRDYNEPERSCTCPDCVAADLYVGEVA